MLGRVAHDGQQDEADEGLGDVHRLDERVDRAHEVLGAHGHGHGGQDQDGGGGERAELRLLGRQPRLGRGHALLGQRLGVEEVGVRAQLEAEVEHVEDQQDDGGAVAEDQHGGVRVGLGAGEHGVQGRGDDEGGRGDGHEGGHGRGGRRVELLLDAARRARARVVDAAEEEAAAQDEQDVGEDAAEHGGLDDADLAVAEGDDGDLDIVS